MLISQRPDVLQYIPEIHAPFSALQLSLAAEVQKVWHPYVCPNDKSNLTVTENGLTCTQCTHQQTKMYSPAHVKTINGLDRTFPLDTWQQEHMLVALSARSEEDSLEVIQKLDDAYEAIVRISRDLSLTTLEEAEERYRRSQEKRGTSDE